MNGIVGIVFWECDDLGCFRLDSHSCSKDTRWCLTNWGHGWPRANCRRRGPHWHLPTAVPPWAADLRKRRCRQQLRTWPLHHREGDCRPGLGQDQEVGWQLHRFLYWTIGSDFLSLMTGVFVRMVRIVGWAPNWVLWPLEQLNLFINGFPVEACRASVCTTLAAVALGPALDASCWSAFLWIMERRARSPSQLLALNVWQKPNLFMFVYIFVY